MTGHSEKAALFLADEKRVDWHNQTLWMVRQKRDKAAQSVPEWENLREQASQIKEHVLSNLSGYLVRFEKRAVENGVQVHWASDAAEFNEIILQIVRENNAVKLVKNKSMLTEECGLNPFLEKNNIEVVDTPTLEKGLFSFAMNRQVTLCYLLYT